MGLLIEGVWSDVWYNTKDNGGKFVRPDSQFRNSVSDETGHPYPVEANRYHLYISHACPWAHRTMIVRELTGLKDAISVSCVEPVMLKNGWTFSDALPDHVAGHTYLHQVYTAANPKYTGRVTVPILWDLKAQTIVNNESSEIIRLMNGPLAQLGHNDVELYPEAHRDEIDSLNALIYPNINNGVYRSGFATSQEAYEEAVRALFDTLDLLETRLCQRKYLVGETLTEADVRLFTTLIRFDVVYHTHFKCNLKHLLDYPNLSRYVKRIYDIPGVSSTCHIDHVKTHYFASHPTINPSGIIPVGPQTWLLNDTDKDLENLIA